MPLIQLDKVSLAFGLRPLLDGVKLEIRRGEQICLVGRNGEGKTSLLRLLAGEIQPDSGSIRIRPGTRIASLAQEVTGDSPGCVFDVVAGGLSELGRLLSEYHHCAAGLEQTHSPEAVRRLSELQHELESRGGWELEQRVEMVLSRLGLDGRAGMETLSGGWRRRAMLARALVCEPDVLLLDEPTNHLDIEAIAWLEEFLVDFPGAVLFVSHDRAFLKRLATRMIELDRGRLNSFPGCYDDYLREKTRQLAVEETHNALFDKKLSQEEIWIRQGVKARRTRNEGRVRALEKLRAERRGRRERTGLADLQIEHGEKSGRLVFEAEAVDFSYGGKAVIGNLTTRIMRGDRIGIIGPNGAGKSTLIKLLLGQLEPDRGRLYRGTRIQAAYFDQQRDQLDPDAMLMESIGGGAQSITVNGRTRHVAGYLRDFLFPPERLRSPVRTLSGGERNRLLLARLFAQPANLLVMDEPTNDLDVETLELLEELMLDYPGTILLVSHDRAFLDHVVTSTLVFEGKGVVEEYVGGYTDWLRHSKKKFPPQKARETQRGGEPQPLKALSGKRPRGTAKKLNMKEQRERLELPSKIESLEAERARLHAVLGDSTFYQDPASNVPAALARLENLTREIEEGYARWEALEALAALAPNKK